MQALVTGPGGFLGRYLTEQLVQQGVQVRGFSRQEYDFLDDLGVESSHGDIRDAQAVAEACRGVDVVYHTAAVAGVWGPWRRYYEINTLGTKHVLDGCLQHNVPKLIYTSSPSVTFDGGDQSGVDESAPYPKKWLCHYPHAKALGEQMVLEANGENDLMTCALRPHLIWGPRDPHLVPRLLQRAQAGQLRRVGDGKNMIDMIHVENAAAAHWQAAAAMRPDAEVCGNAYFLSQGEPVNCWDWIDEILTSSGADPIQKSISFQAAWRIGAVMEFFYGLLRLQSEPRMTRFVAAQLAKDHYFDIRRAHRDFGYSPIVSTEEGMRGLFASQPPPTSH